MRAAIVLSLLLIAIPLVAADYECGDPYKGDQPGQVKMDIDFGWPIEKCRVAGVEGGVQVDLANCEAPGIQQCTWLAQGTPGADYPQSATVEFTLEECGEVVTCTMTAQGGLPVELVEFQVE